MHLDVDAAGEQRLDELQRERRGRGGAAARRRTTRHLVVVDLELDVALGAGPVGQPDERDRVARW